MRVQHKKRIIKFRRNRQYMSSKRPKGALVGCSFCLKKVRRKALSRHESVCLKHRSDERDVVPPRMDATAHSYGHLEIGKRRGARRAAICYYCQKRINLDSFEAHLDKAHPERVEERFMHITRSLLPFQGRETQKGYYLSS